MALSWSRAPPSGSFCMLLRLAMHVEQLLKLFWVLCVAVVGPSRLCTLQQAAVSMRPGLTKSQGSEGHKLLLTTVTTYQTGLKQECLSPV